VPSSRPDTEHAWLQVGAGALKHCAAPGMAFPRPLFISKQSIEQHDSSPVVRGYQGTQAACHRALLVLDLQNASAFFGKSTITSADRSVTCPRRRHRVAAVPGMLFGQLS
jgi:hypothetical protein